MKVISKLLNMFHCITCFLIFLLLINAAVKAQNPDFSKMTAEERTAYMAKMHEASENDWFKMMNKLLIKTRILPAAADDPKRPKYLFQKEGSTNWNDSIGNTYVRSSWGNWSNYDESKAGKYKLPDPLILKDGKRVKDAKAWWNERRPQ